ncbi:hypothetical protein GKZ68_08895 [Hymenobacter sp. BRD128]|uniref:hypothetical protein n=1 Tax=Hymenobacter sp. BRD128 TaxID=2675878 RepID=UPI00156519D5|nr:hypothetical protein [Hymenobacter sp. BRD128]QKG56727.1 hypothetical protein GKZ68_08895 [Hymenobacter sp. BRD128]
MAISAACRPVLASLGLALALLPTHLHAQTTAPTAATPAAVAAPRPSPEEVTAQAQATVALLTRRVDSLRVAYRQQQRLYSDLGGKFTSFLAGQQLSRSTRFALTKNNVRATADLLLVCHSRLTQLRALTQALRNANEQAALSSPTESNPLGISLVDYTKSLVATKAVDKNRGRRLVDLAAHLTQTSFVSAVPTVGPMLNAVGQLLTSVRANSLSSDGFTAEQVRLIENGLRPTLNFFAALDAARADNQASLLTLDNELMVLQHQLSQLYRPYAQLVAYQDDISAYYTAPPPGQPATNALDVSNISRMSNYVAASLNPRFASLDQSFTRAQNQGDILDPDSYLTPANNSAEAAVQLAAQLQSLTDRLPVITAQYSAAIRAAIAQGQQDGLIKADRATKVIADETARAKAAAETYQQARASERFGEVLGNVKPLFKLY